MRTISGWRRIKGLKVGEGKIFKTLSEMRNPIVYEKSNERYILTALALLRCALKSDFI